MKQIAIYGKGGIGKSTIAANLSHAMAMLGKKVLQIGCDPKHDSTRLLLGGAQQETVLNILKDRALASIRLEEFLVKSSKGVDCIEAGGPEPGVGCAGRGIISMAGVLESSGLAKENYDLILYDVLGDVVCGGFAVPMRDGFAEEIYIVTSGEIMSLYAANNICKGLKNLTGAKLAGVIGNSRGGEKEKDLIECFSKSVGTEMVACFQRNPIFKEAEAARETVLSFAPASEVAIQFKELAKKILHMDSLKKVKPSPLSEAQFEEFLSGFFKDAQNRKAQKNVPAISETQAEKSGEEAQIGKSRWERYLKKELKENIFTPQSKAVAKNEDLYSCALAGAFSVSNQIRDAVTLMHSPAGCAHTSFAGTSLNALSESLQGKINSVPRLFCTNLQEKEMVFGGEELLEKTLTVLLPKNPSAIFVISSCPSAIIGDDPKRVIAKLKNLDNGRSLPILHLDTDGIFAGDYAQGIFNAYANITENFVEQNVQPEKGFLNLVAEPAVSSTESHFAFFKELLFAFGLKLNCRYIHHTTLAELKKFKKAELNILAGRDSVALSLRSYLEKSLSANFFPDPLPVGWRESCKWARDLSHTLFGTVLPAENWIQNQHAPYHARLEKIKNRFCGARAILLLYQNSWEWLWELLSSLEVEVLDSSFYFSAFEDSVKTEKPLKNWIEEQKPDLLISNYARRDLPPDALSCTVPLYPAPGFFGALEVAERWSISGSANLKEGWRNDLS